MGALQAILHPIKGYWGLPVTSEVLISIGSYHPSLRSIEVTMLKMLLMHMHTHTNTLYQYIFRSQVFMWYNVYNEAYLNEHFEHLRIVCYANFSKINSMLDKQTVASAIVSTSEQGSCVEVGLLSSVIYNCFIFIQEIHSSLIPEPSFTSRKNWGSEWWLGA